MTIINKSKVCDLIAKYNENFNLFNDSAHEEYFKWRAVKKFQDVWFREGAMEKPFAEMLKAALSESSVLIDNSSTHPSNGAIKLAEKHSEEVKNLFCNVLFADTGDDLEKRQENVERFMFQMEELRKKEFPDSWKYKQDDRHAAITYLTLFDPDENYVYKYSVAEAFANYVDFGLELGAGADFSLKNYYAMCDEVVEVLREDFPELIERHHNFVDDSCFDDKSNHMLAFDIIYCASAYDMIEAGTRKSRKTAIEAYNIAQMKEKEREEKLLIIQDLQNSRDTLQQELDEIGEISLEGVRVSSAKYGEGIIIKQDENQRSKVTVEFKGKTLNFVIDQKFSARPVFEDDEEIVEMYTRYNEVWDGIKKIDKKIKAIGLV